MCGPLRVNKTALLRVTYPVKLIGVRLAKRCPRWPTGPRRGRRTGDETHAGCSNRGMSNSRRCTPHLWGHWPGVRQCVGTRLQPRSKAATSQGESHGQANNGRAALDTPDSGCIFTTCGTWGRTVTGRSRRAARRGGYGGARCFVWDVSMCLLERYKREWLVDDLVQRSRRRPGTTAAPNTGQRSYSYGSFRPRAVIRLGPGCIRW